MVEGLDAFLRLALTFTSPLTPTLTMALTLNPNRARSLASVMNAKKPKATKVSAAEDKFSNLPPSTIGELQRLVGVLQSREQDSTEVIPVPEDYG